MDESEEEDKNLLEKNSNEGSEDDLSPSVENKHKLTMKQLGDVKLSQDFPCYIDDGQNPQLQWKECSVYTFLHGICGGDPGCKKTIKRVKAVQNFTDEDIKSILVFVANLENNDAAAFSWSTRNNNINTTLPSELSELDENEFLQMKKTYVILVLISFGVSPVKIKKCLENENNTNENPFEDLNWKNVCKQAINLRKNIENVKCYSDQYYCNGNEIWTSLLFLNYIYIVEASVNDNNNFNNEDLNLSRENLYHQYYKYMGGWSSDDHFKDFAASLSLLFILRYLELKNKNQEIQNLFGKNGLFTNLFRNINWNKNTAHEKNLTKLSEGYENDFGLYLKSNWFVPGKFENFYDAMFQDFYNIIDNLPQECIFIFMCEMMRGVTLTHSQLVYVKQKIQNQDLSSYLEKINYDPEYKLSDTFIIKNDTKIYLINYLCKKLFRGIGYLLAMTFILAIHAAIAAILVLLINHWFIYVLCTILALSTLYFVISGIKNNSKPFEKCVDFMQRAYDKTVGYWIKIWVLHHSTNKIPEPPIINNYPPDQKSIVKNISQSEGQFNLSMEKDKNEKGK